MDKYTSNYHREFAIIGNIFNKYWMIIIVSVFIIIFTLMVVFVFSHKTEYKITIKECWNEIVWSEDCVPYRMLCYMADQQENECLNNIKKLVDKRLFRIVENNNYGIYDMCIYSKLSEENKCENKEVDELILMKDITSENPTCNGSVIKVRDCNVNNKSDCIYGKCYQTITIKRENLNHNWLSSNCECINLIPRKNFLFVCLKYKCQNYEVTTI